MLRGGLQITIEGEGSAWWPFAELRLTQGRYQGEEVPQSSERGRGVALARDGQQCVAILADGSRCPTTAPLEIHHLKPGLGLAAGDDDLISVCRRHNPRGSSWSS